MAALPHQQCGKHKRAGCPHHYHNSVGEEHVQGIEKAIINSELGITPENNGEVIRISIPPLTEERRKALVKQSKAEAEQAKVSVRNARRDAIEGLKKAIKQGMPEDVEKDAEASAQKLHDKFLKKIDDLFSAKEKENS